MTLVLPIDITELMLTRTAFHRNGDIKGAARRYSSTNAGHDDDGDVVERDVCRRFRYEHEALIEAEEVPLVGLDTTLDTGLLMVAAIC